MAQNIKIFNINTQLWVKIFNIYYILYMYRGCLDRRPGELKDQGVAPKDRGGLSRDWTRWFEEHKGLPLQGTPLPPVSPYGSRTR